MGAHWHTQAQCASHMLAHLLPLPEQPARLAPSSTSGLLGPKRGFTVDNALTAASLQACRLLRLAALSKRSAASEREICSCIPGLKFRVTYQAAGSGDDMKPTKPQDATQESPQTGHLVSGGVEVRLAPHDQQVLIRQSCQGHVVLALRQGR